MFYFIPGFFLQIQSFIVDDGAGGVTELAKKELHIDGTTLSKLISDNHASHANFNSNQAEIEKVQEAVKPIKANEKVTAAPKPIATKIPAIP